MDLLVDGKRVYAATGGRTPADDQPAVLFVHGAAMDHTVWSLQARYFAHHGRRVLAPDLPGHGRSEGPPLTTVPDLAGWLHRAMEAAGIEQAALVGHSMGSLVALEAAAGRPEHVWALALLAMALPMAVHPDLMVSAEAGDHHALDLVTGWGHGRRAQIGGARAPGLWLAGGTLRLLERAGERVLFTDLAACEAYDGGLDAAARVQCPTLLLLGERDRMTPAAGASSLATAIAGVETVIIPGCGHMMMAERPDQVLDALIEII